MNSIGVWAMLLPSVVIMGDAFDRKRNAIDRGTAILAGAVGIIGFAILAIVGA